MSDSSVNRSRRRDRQAARARRRRRRLIPLAGLLALVVLGIVVIAGGGGGSSSGDSAGTAGSSIKTVLSAHAAKPLPAPISSEAVVAAAGGPLIIGGLDSTEASVSGVFQLGSSGAVRSVGSLTAPLHDSAATMLGNQVIVFGGGSETSGNEVQALSPSGGNASEVGQLPTVRSDLSAVTVGGRAYVLGGYDGETPLDSVLSTADGRSFTQIAKLPQPARYLAVAAVGGRIYAFGGETGEEEETDAIREVDPASRSARVIGHLPQPISHAAALVLGGHLYVIGGETGGVPSDAIWRFDPSRHTVVKAGRLPFPVAAAGAAATGSTGYLIGGAGKSGAALSSVVVMHEQHMAETAPASGAKSPGAPKKGSASTSSPPFEGRLMIADRGNNRLLVVNARKQVLWRFPSHAHPAPPGGFYFPDDAFFTHGGTQIISNEEQNERIVQLAFPSGKLLWSYGHPGVTGSEPGYLHEPDDAYLWANGTISVADAQNCRVLIISPAKKVLKEFGEPSRCEHEPPVALGSPNGDTPLPNGNLLISEVNGSYIDEITPHGKLVWSVQLPIVYPSDPQQLGPDRYLVADYATPGGIYEFNRKGKILWSYHPSSGPGMLDHPSLAERLPGGLIAVNDDYRHRVAIIDPHKRKIVWQYGHTDVPGRGPDHLNTPDGFDLLSPQGTTPTHPYTG